MCHLTYELPELPPNINFDAVHCNLFREFLQEPMKETFFFHDLLCTLYVIRSFNSNGYIQKAYLYM